ncbi:hypothetical protein M9Y10_030270 [Tritrichomonas musculus]|uniref:Surface antigen BspA-like n=1 Tax=Tritrichomonas musculus TaxID=1915356 RepID=A0ABR2KQA6_9EUKA
MQKSKAKNKNVSEFTPPEPKFIERVNDYDKKISEDDLKKIIIIPRYYFHNAFSDYIYEINFSKDSKLQEINALSFSIPPNVDGDRNISNKIFMHIYSHLYSIVFPPSLQKINSYSMGGCPYLNQIQFLKDDNNENFLRSIGDNAFTDTKIESIIIPDHIENIGSNCFPKTLKTIEFENGCPLLNNLGKRTFSNTQIEKIALPKNVRPFIDSNSFLMCRNLKDIIFDQYQNDEEELDQEELDENYCSLMLGQTQVEKLEIFKTNINLFSFYNTPKLTTISIRKSGDASYIKTKGVVYTKSKEKLIAAERNVKSATISSNCKIISNFAFNMKCFEKVSFEKNSKLYKISVFAFSESGIKSITIPDSVKIINDGAFYHCQNLKTVELGNLTESIGYSAFSGTNITSIKIPKTVIEIGIACFYKCSKLSQVDFEEESNLAKILSFAFSETSISTISIPKSVKKIDDYCFMNCKKLKKINIDEESILKKIGNECFCGTQVTEFHLPSTVKKCHFSLTKAKVISIKNGGLLKDVAYFQALQITEFCIPPTVEAISPYAFYECSNLAVVKMVDVSNSMLDCIHRGAFLDCQSLKEFEVPKTVKYFGPNSFKNCVNLKIKISISTDQFVTVKKSAFQNSGIISFECQSKHVSVNDSAFQDCSNLKRFSSEAARKLHLGHLAFMNCSSLSTVKINQDVPFIFLGASCFENSGIKEFDIPNSLDNILNCCFKNCKKLTNVNIKDDSCLLSFADEAFYGSKIKSIKIPLLAQEINESCFENCKDLKKVTLPKNEKTKYFYFGERCFACSGVESLHFPIGRWDFQKECFYNCKNLKNVTFSEYAIIYQILQGAFESTAIESIIFPIIRERIRLDVIFYEHAFRNCKQLRSVTFTSYYKVIPWVFAGCDNLSEINVNEKVMFTFEGTSFDNNLENILIVKNFGNKEAINAFFTCSELSYSYFPHFDFRNTMLMNENSHLSFNFYKKFDSEYHNFEHYYNKAQKETDDDKVFVRTVEKINNGYYLENGKKLFFCDFSTQSLSVPKKTEIIKSRAFTFTNLKKINFEEGSKLTKIKNFVFENLQIEEISIPDSVISIGESAFRDCKELKVVNISKASQLTTIGKSAFEKVAIEKFTFPSNLRTVDEYAFYRCEKLAMIENYSNEITFGDNSFYGSSISTIKFPSKSTFEYSSFKKCNNLKKLTFLSKPKEIIFGEESFAFSGLEELDFDCIVDIQPNAFIYCKSLKQVSFKGKNIKCDMSSFSNSNIESFIMNNKSPVQYYTSNQIITDVFTANIEKISFVLKMVNFWDDKETTVKHFMNHKCYALDNELVEADLIDNSSLTEKLQPGKTVQIKKNEILRVPSNVKKLNFQTVPHIKKIQWGTNCMVDDLGPEGLFRYYNLIEITIPKLVRKIPAHSFEHCHYLKVVQFDEDSLLEEIEEFGFASTGIEKINLPKSLKIIGSHSFFDCHKLKEVSFEGEIIGEEAFSRTGLTTFNLSNHTKTIETGAFQYCRKLTTFNIDIELSELCEIGSYSFSETSITEINIPAGVTTIKGFTFDGCVFLQKITFSNDSKLSKIERFAFSGDLSLEKIVIPSSLFEHFKDHATIYDNFYSFYFECYSSFYYLNKRLMTFEGLEIDTRIANEDDAACCCFITASDKYNVNPNCFTENNCYVINNELIYANTFDNSLLYSKKAGNEDQNNDQIKENEILRVPSNVKKLNFNIISHIKKIQWGTNCMVNDLGPEGLFRYYNLIEITIPKNVKKIPAHSFENCHFLKVVQFQEGSKLKEIEEFGFANTRIERIDLPKSLKIVGSHSFFKCRDLKEVSFEGGVIGDEAFSMAGLTTFNLSNHTKTIGNGAFQYCRKLTTFNIDIEKSKLSELGSFSFAETSITEINIPPGIKTIKKSTFNGCQFLKAVTFPIKSKLEKVEDYSFAGTLSLETINLPKTFKTLSFKAFINTPSLLYIMNKPNPNFRVLKNYSVYGKDGSIIFVPRNLTKFRVLEDCHIVHSGTFCGPNLERVSFSDNSLISIEECAFAHSTALKRVHLPNSLRSIGDECFIDCQSLERLDFEPVTKIKEIPKFCFAFSGLKNIRLPLSVEIIQDSSFCNCHNLKSVNLIDTNAKYIGNNAFSDCKLNEIKLPSSVRFIGINAFAGNRSLRLIDMSNIKVDIKDTSQLPVLGFLRQISRSKRLLKKAISKFVERQALKRNENDENNQQQQQQENENGKEQAMIQPPAPLNMISKKNPVIVKPGGNSTRPTSSRVASQSKISNAPLPVLPPAEDGQNKSPRKINRSEKPAVNFNEKDFIEEDIDDTIDTAPICFVHDFAFSHSSVKLFNFDLDEYKWFSFFDYCRRIDLFHVNKDIHLSIQKMAKQRANSLSGCLFKIKSLDSQESDFKIPMLIEASARRTMKMLNPFSFMNFHKLTNITLDDSIQVSEIPKFCFAYSRLKEITIPSSVAVISESAFYSCTSLRKVIFSKESNLQEIKNFAFFECKKLLSINLPDKLEIIPKRCFALSGLKSIKLPKSTKIVDSMAFYGCSKLAKVAFNKGIKTLNEYSFANDILLESIELPDSLTTIKSYSFSNCCNLKEVKTTENTNLIEIFNGSFENTIIESLAVNRNAKKLFEPTCVPFLNSITFCKGKPTNFIQNQSGLIFESIKNKPSFYTLLFAPKKLDKLQINKNCFCFSKGLLDDMNNLEKIEVTKEVTDICIYEFPSYNHLRSKVKEIRINSKSSTLGENIFSYFNSLEIVEFNSKMTNLKIFKHAFLSCPNLCKVKIPCSCVSIGEGAFKNCIKLEDVEIDSKSSIEVIKKEAFYNCSSLSSIVIPSSVAMIEEASFMNCSKLEKVEIDEKSELKTIQKNAFRNCTSLTSFVLPSKCSFVGPSCFMDCAKLTSFKYEGSDLSSINCRTFFNCSSLAKIKFTHLTSKSYRSLGDDEEDDDNKYCEEEDENEFYVFNINDEAFMNCSSLKEVVFEDNKKVTKLKTAFIYPPKVAMQWVRKRAFCNCKALTKASFFLIDLGCFDEKAFENCSSLKTIEINSRFWKFLVTENKRRNAFLGTNGQLKIKLLDNGKLTDIPVKIDSKPEKYREKRHFKKYLSSLKKPIIENSIVSEKVDDTKSDKKLNRNYAGLLFYTVEIKNDLEPPKVNDSHRIVSEKPSKKSKKVGKINQEEKKVYKIDKIKRKRHFKEHLSFLNRSFLIWPDLNEKEKNCDAQILHYIKLDQYGICVPKMTEAPGPCYYSCNFLYGTIPIRIGHRCSPLYHQQDTPTEYNYDVPESKIPLII